MRRLHVLVLSAILSLGFTPPFTSCGGKYC